MKLFQCQNCGQPLYFENTRCESCGLTLGYLPTRETVTALREDGASGRRLAAPGQAIAYCANGVHGVCNWLIPADSADQFCAACRHNRTIPDLTQRRQSRPLAHGGGRQASPVLHAPEAETASRHQGGGSERPRLRFSRRRRRAGVYRPRQRAHHHQSRRGRRRRARAASPPDGRALPHPARPFPSRDRPLLLEPPGRQFTRASSNSASCSATSAATMAARCRTIMPRVLPPTGRSVSSRPMRAPTRGRISPRPGRTTSTWWIRSKPPTPFGLIVKPKASQSFAAKIDFNPHGSDMDRLIELVAAAHLRGQLDQPQHGPSRSLSFRAQPAGDRQACLRA